MQTVLVCGGRDFGIDLNEHMFVVNMLDAENAYSKIGTVVTGMARGADNTADMWAANRMIERKQHPITPKEWEKYGRAAGPKRNQRMLDTEEIDLVIAFPGGQGTRDMIHRSLIKGVPVKRFRYPGGYQHGEMLTRKDN